MRRISAGLSITLLLAAPLQVSGATAVGPGVLERPQAPDAELARILGEVEKANLEATVRKLVAFGSRHTESNQDLHGATGIGPAVQWVFDTMSADAARSAGRMKVELQEFKVPAGSPRITRDTIVRNVVATIRGSEAPSRISVFSAHIDSRASDVLDPGAEAPGADDDASGVAVILELARLFATRSPRATIVLTAVSGEEQKLYGSAHQAEHFKAAGAMVEAMVCNDIVGSSTADDGARDAHTLRMFTDPSDGNSLELGRFARSVAENDETHMKIRAIYRRDRTLRSGDQASYLSNGYPALRFTEAAENYDHQHQNVRVDASGKQLGDRVQFLDFDYLAGVTRVNAAVAWSLVAAPGAPGGVVLDASSLSNTSTLTWTRGPEPHPAGYEVVWRETTEPDWTHVVAVGNVGTASFPHFSRDNVFFGVRAVDEAGHRSLVSLPVTR